MSFLACVPILFHYRSMSEKSAQLIDRKIKGRGTTLQPQNRFDRFVIEAVEDGWDPAEIESVLQASVFEERAKSALSYIQSPDLPFDRSINPYRGCEHGCIYCYARPSHAYQGYSAGLDFETKLHARPNIAQVLEVELAKPSYTVRPIALGSNTDPYQAIETQYQVTRSILNVLSQTNHPVAIVTKGALVERDIDILSDMARLNLVRVGISVTTLCPKLSRKMEPRAPNPKRRLQIIERLSKQGIPVRIMASPLVPGLSDHELERILEQGKNAGASSASWIMLRLPREVSELFQEWLQQHYPNSASRVLGHLRTMHGGQLYQAHWGTRMRGSGPYAEMIEKRFRVAIKKLGLVERAPKLDCSLFQPPTPIGGQLKLF